MNRPELTSEKFISFKPLSNMNAVRAYRSGDLVRWDEDGNIEYFGRIDRQVKLRGLRIELGEVENAVASFPGISQTVVDVKGKTNPQLCCYYTSEFPIDDDALKARLSETLTEYMVPSVYMRLDKLPLNPNGKVDRNALPEPEITEEEFLPPETEAEKEVFAAVSKLLGTEAFGVTSNLIAQGMSSLAAMRLAAVLETQYGLKIRVSDIMKHPTVRNIAAFGKSENEDKSLHHVPECEEYPITENQKGLWIDWELHRDTTQYNIPSIYVFDNVSGYDYVVYEQEFLTSPKAIEYEAYFDSLLDSVTSSGYPDSAEPDEIADAPEESKLGTLYMKIDAEPVDAFCQKYAVTPGAYLQAAFGEVFQSLTREEKPMYITISNGRSADTALQSTVGMYVRTLPVVFAGNSENHGGQSVVDYVRNVRNSCR